MATIKTLADDLTPEVNEDVETVRFDHDGKTYELDLGASNRNYLAGAQAIMDRCAAAGREVPHHSAYAQLTAPQRRKIRQDLGREPRTSIRDAEVAEWLEKERLVQAGPDIVVTAAAAPGAVLS